MAGGGPVLKDVDAVLLDLDGTVYEGTRPIPGAVEAIHRLRAQGVTLRFLTNTDAIPPGALLGKLHRLGIEARPGEVSTPVALAAGLFRRLPGCQVLAVASPEVRAELAPFLVKPCRTPTHVLVADPSRSVTYDDLNAAFRALRAGAELVATQVNRFARRDDGEHLDTGAWVRLLEYAAGVEARVLGKPSPDFFRLALRELGCPPERALVVGDDPATDVAGAKRAGLRAVLVRTGKGAGPGNPGDAGRLAPDAVIGSLAALPELLAGGGS